MTESQEALDRLVERTNAFLETGAEETFADVATLLVAFSGELAGGGAEQAVTLNDIGLAFQRCYAQTGVPVFIDAAIQAADGALACDIPDLVIVSLCMSNFANALLTRYGLSGAVGDLDTAYRAAQASVKRTSADHKFLGQHLNVLGNVARAIHGLRGEQQYLHEAISAYRAAVAAAPAGQPLRCVALGNLGSMLRLLAQTNRDPAVLDEAFEAIRAAAEGADAADPGTPMLHNNLATVLLALAGRQSEPRHLAAAVRILRGLVAEPLSDPGNRRIFLINLNLALRTSIQAPDMEAEECRGLLEEALRSAQDALAITLPGVPLRHNALTALGTTYKLLFKTTGDQEFLASAAAVSRTALAEAPNGHPQRPSALIALGAALSYQYSHTSDEAALDEARRLVTAALALMPEDDPARADALDDLGIVLYQGAKRDGDLGRLHNAESCFRAAYEACDPDRPERIAYLNRLGTALRMRFGLTGDGAALEQALDTARRVLAMAPQDSEFHAVADNGLATVMTLAYYRTADSAQLDEAIRLYRRVLASSTASADSRTRAGFSLALALRAGFEQNDDLAALDEAVRLCKEIRARPLPQESLRASSVGVLGLCLAVRFERLGNPSDIDEAVDAIREAVRGAPANRLSQAEGMGNLSMVLRLRHGCTGRLEDLSEAVDVGRVALRTYPDTAAQRAIAMVNVAAALHQMYFEHGDTALIDEAIGVLRGAERVGAAESTARTLVPATLATALGTRFKTTGDAVYLDEALRLSAIALAAVPPAGPFHSRYLTQHAGLLRIDYDRASVPHTLDEAELVARSAVDAGRPGDATRAVGLTHLSSVLLRRHDTTRDLQVIEEATHLSRLALADTGPDSPDWAPCTATLCCALIQGSEATDDPAPLREAEARHRSVLARLAPDSPFRAVHLSGLCETLWRLGARFGDGELLHEAVEVGSAAVAAAPPCDTAVTESFARAVMSVHLHLGEDAALHEAVDLFRSLLADPAVTSPDARARIKGNLAMLLKTRLQQRYDQSDSDEVVRLHREALDAVAVDHGNRSQYISSLADALGSRYKHDKDPATLEEALRLQRMAVQNPPASAMARAMSANIHGRLLQAEAARTGSVATAAQAATVLRQAVTALADENPNRGPLQFALATVLFDIHQLSQDEAALAEGRRVLTELSASETTAALLRLAASGWLASAEMSAGRPAAALETYESMVRMLPLIAPRAWNRAQRERRLGLVSGLAAQTAAAAVAAGRPERAVEMLEQTRGLLAAAVIDNRTDPQGLRDAKPEYHSELEVLRNRAADLERAEPGPYDPLAVDLAEHRRIAGLGRRRRQLARDWDSLLGRIRALPGFADFLLPPRFEQLHQQAGYGPIVMIYTTHDTGGGALILTGEARQPVRALPLPDLTVETAVQQAELLRDSVGSRSRDLKAQVDVDAETSTAVFRALEWLWDAAAGPILDALGPGGDGTPTDVLPRVWWCPVGVLARLPIQAAGRYRESGRRTVPDRTVSSVIPTIRALGKARIRPAADCESAVIVAMPATPGTAPLTGVTREVADVTRLLGAPEILSGPAATHGAVTAALARHPAAHFACHGVSDQADPAASRLLLYDHAATPLTVAAISRLDLAGAELAYLSACSTADTTEDLADEAVHLTAAVQLAGYRHVIGTLWPIDDTVAARVAVDFYRHLTGGGAHPPRPELSAHALAAATRRLRDELPTMPVHWAAFLHQGS